MEAEKGFLSFLPRLPRGESAVTAALCQALRFFPPFGVLQEPGNLSTHLFSFIVTVSFRKGNHFLLIAG